MHEWKTRRWVHASDGCERWIVDETEAEAALDEADERDKAAARDFNKLAEELAEARAKLVAMQKEIDKWIDNSAAVKREMDAKLAAANAEINRKRDEYTVEAEKQIRKLKEKLAAAEKALADFTAAETKAVWRDQEKMHEQQDRIAALEAEVRRRDVVIELQKKDLCPEQVGKPCQRLEDEKAETARLKAYLKGECGVIWETHYSCPCDDDRHKDCPIRPARPDAAHDKAHCPAVVHKGEYDRDTCYIDHDKKRRRSK